MTVDEEIKALMLAIERQLDRILAKTEEAHALLKDTIRDCEAQAARRRRTVDH